MFDRAIEDFIGEAPWNGVLSEEEILNPLPSSLLSEKSIKSLKHEISQADACLQRDGVYRALSHLSASASSLKFFRSHFHKIIEGGNVSKESIFMILDAANFLWGWASHAQTYGSGKMPSGVPISDRSLPPHQVLFRAIYANSSPVVNEVLLNFRFSSDTLIRLLYYAISNGCSAEIYQLLVRYGASYLNACESNVALLLHQLERESSSCPFFSALETNSYMRNLEDFSYIVGFHAQLYPDLLVEARIDRGEPLVVTAVRLKVPWAITESFLPKTLPRNWLINDNPKPFGQASITKNEFIAALQRNIPADNPIFSCLNDAAALTKQASDFPAYWTNFSYAAINGHTEAIIHNLLILTAIMNENKLIGVVRNRTTQKNYQKTDFCDALCREALSCPTAESFLAIITVCTNTKTHLTIDDQHPLHLSPRLLDALLARSNLSLIVQFMHGMAAESPYYDIGVLVKENLLQNSPAPFVSIVKCKDTTTDFLIEATLAFQDVEPRKFDEALANQQRDTPISILVSSGRLDLLQILLLHSKQLTIVVNNKTVSLLAHVLSDPDTRTAAAASAVQISDLAMALVLQARRVFGVSNASKPPQALVTHMNKPALDGTTPLQKALELQKLQSQTPLIISLLESGASPFAPATNKKKKSTVIHMLIEENNISGLGNLLEMHKKYSTTTTTTAGLASCVDNRCIRPLDLAVSLRNRSAVTVLFQYGATLLPFTASSPLIKALMNQRKSPGKDADDLVKLLLVGWTLKHTITLLCTATKEHHSLLVTFMKAQESIVLKRYLKNPKQRAYMLQMGVDALKDGSPLLDVLLDGNMDRSAAEALKLFDAIEFLTADQMTRLVKDGAMLSKRDDGVKLHFKAVQAANIPVLDVLLTAGAMDVQESDMEGNSLLHWAVLKTPADLRDPVIQYLVEKEPDLLFALNRNNQIPSEYAKSKRIKKILEAYEDEQNDKITGTEEVVVEKSQVVAEKSGRRLRKRGETDNNAAAVEIEEDIGDLTVLGPLDEPEKNKRRRLSAMIEKLPTALEDYSSASGGDISKVVVNSDVVKGGEVESVDEAAGSAAAAESFGAIVTAAADATLPEVEIAAVEVYDSGDDYVDDDAVEEVVVKEGESLPTLGGGGSSSSAAEYFSELGTLQGLPWELIVTREAYLEWGGMDASYRRMVLLKLREIGQGRWESLGACKRRMRDVPPELNLWRCKFTKAGRIVFDIAQDYSASRGNYTDLIRIWSITLNHDRYMNEVQKVIQSFAKSHCVTAALRLTPVEGSADTGAGPRDHKAEQKLPRVYRRQGGEEEIQAQMAKNQHSVLQYPPATAGQGSYTLLKFFDLTTELARAILSGMAGAIEAPFRVSPEETRIITATPGRSIILAGRSGTGKTTCACFKLFARWLTAWRLGEPHNQVFVTASGTLRRQVAQSFAKMRRAVVPPDVADELEALVERPILTLKDVPSEAFPLFLSQKTYLEALDGTLAVPFFPRREDGSIMWERGGDTSDPDGMSQEIDLSPDSDGDDSEEDISDDEMNLGFDDDGKGGAGGGGNDGAGGAQARRWHRQEMGFTEFQAKWSQFVPQDLRKGSRVPPALVWTDLVSYIKGSAEAVRSPTGHLTLEQYLEIGRKRAPNFDSELRADVYRVFEAYEKFKKSHSRYDTADVVGHISRRLIEEGGYNGVDISDIFRDEVQDFMQGELLLDLRISQNPNELMLCGDSAQTIARGLGFRFTDIQTLFYEEGTAALASQKEAAEKLKLIAAGGGGGGVNAAAVNVAGGRAPLQMPIIEHLTVNYRTHSGILDAAASTVDLLRRYFPQHIDNMQREKAFFSGPPALLVCGGGAEDMARLLSWSDKQGSQVEFGAHQIILVRDEAAKQTLPKELRGARPLTIPQAKGLEFNDVLLWNFFSDSMAKKEWRVLLNYLKELEREESTAEASTTAGRRRLLSVEEAEVEGVGKLGQGTLRPLENVDINAIRPLCDELKHLYTALTRAKNFVAVVDCDAEARAPFYYVLARLGLGKIVTDVGEVDKTHLGLSKVESAAAEWAERGIKLMEISLFEYAALDFAKAGDGAMEQYCLARNTMANAVEKAAEAPTVARQLYLTAGLQLMDLAINGTRPRDLVDALKARGQSEYTRKVWARHAAFALERAGESTPAASLWIKLGRFQRARKFFISSGDVSGLAKYCAEVSAHLTAHDKQEQAMKWAGEAFRQYKNLRQYKQCLEMLESMPGLSESVKKYAGTVGDPAEEVAHHLLLAADSSTALAASRYLRDPQVRIGLLRKAGMWKEIVEIIGDDVAAAEILIDHVGYAEAAERLLAGIKKKKIASEKELRLLRQCAVAMRNAQFWMVCIEVLRVSKVESAVLGLFVAELAVEGATLLHSQSGGSQQTTSVAATDTAEDTAVLSMLYTVGRNLAETMISSFSTDFILDKDATDGKKLSSSGVVHSEGQRKTSTAIVSSAVALFAKITSYKDAEKLVHVLAELSLARFHLQQQQQQQQYRERRVFGILRCLPLVRKETSTKFDLVVSTTMQQYAEAIGNAIKWLSNNSTRGTVAAPLSLSADARALLNDVVNYWGLLGFKLDKSSSNSLSSTSQSTSSSGRSNSWKINEEKQQQDTLLVSWRKHDHRFLNHVAEFRHFAVAAGGTLPESFTVQNSSECGMSYKDVKCVLIYDLLELLRHYNYLVMEFAFPLEASSSRLVTLQRIPTPQMQKTALKDWFKYIQISKFVRDAVHSASTSLPWLLFAPPQQDFLDKVRHAEQNIWSELVSYMFPVTGNCLENVEEIVQAFSRYLHAASIEESRLMHWASAPFLAALTMVHGKKNEELKKALADGDVGFWLWKVSQCLIPGTGNGEPRKKVILNQINGVADNARRKRLPEAQILVTAEDNEGNISHQHPASLLFEAIDCMRSGIPKKAVTSLSRYLSTYIKAVQRFKHANIGSEASIFIFELAASLSSLSCMAVYRQKPATHVAYLVNNGVLQSIHSIKDIDIGYYIARFTNNDPGWTGWINSMLQQVAELAKRIVSQTANKGTPTVAAAEGVIPGASKDDTNGTTTSNEEKQKKKKKQNEEEEEVDMMKSALFLRRLTLSIGALYCSAMANLATSCPNITRKTVSSLGSALVSVQNTAKILPSAQKQASPVSIVLKSITTAIKAMSSATNLHTLLPPLRSLAREHGVSLLQVSEGGADCREFDVFSATGDLNLVAMKKLPGVISGIANRSGDTSTPNEANEDLTFVVAGTAADVEPEGNNFEEEARAAAALKICQAWQSYRQIKTRTKALKHLRRSRILHNWVQRTLEKHRAFKQAEKDQADARAFSQSTQPIQIKADGGGLEQYALTAVDMVIDNYKNRYRALKHSLEVKVLTPVCEICPHRHSPLHQQQQPLQQRQQQLFKAPEKAGNEKSRSVLKPTAATFIPHASTAEHQANVDAFRKYCAWYENIAAPCLAQVFVLGAALRYIIDHPAQYMDFIDHSDYLESTLAIKESEFWRLLQENEEERHWEHAAKACLADLEDLKALCIQVHRVLNNVDYHYRRSVGKEAGGGAGESGAAGEEAGGAAGGRGGGFDDLDDVEDGYDDIDDDFIVVGKGRKGRSKGKRTGRHR